MSNKNPMEVDAFYNSLNAGKASYAFLCLDDSYRLKFSGGNTGEFLLEQLSLTEPVHIQLDFLAGLLPCIASEVVLIPNIQYMPDRFTDIHLFRIKEGQCVLFIDRTESSLNLQLEQQQRLERNFNLEKKG